MGKQLEVPLSEIRESKVALREVDTTTESYLGLVDSIREKGILNPIVVRAAVDPDTKEKFYALVDGLHRFTASKDAGKTSIPCHVLELDEAEVLEAQIIGNMHRVETKHYAYAKQLFRMFAINPLLTLAEVCKKLGVSTTWVENRLALNNLPEDIGTLVNEGKIKLFNATNLAKLPVEEQKLYLDQAMTMSPQEFPAVVQARVKELREAKRQGRKASEPGEFVPVPRLQKMQDMKSETENPKVGPELVALVKPKNAVEAFKLGVLWAIHLDPNSISEARAKEEQRKKDLEDARKKRADERALAKAEELRAKQIEAANKAVEVQAAHA